MFTSQKAGQPLQGMHLQEKEEDKDERHIGKLNERTQRIKMIISSRFKTT